METRIKEKYETPVLQVVALKMEGIICESVMSASVSDLNDFLPNSSNPFGDISLSSANPFASNNPFGFPTF